MNFSYQLGDQIITVAVAGETVRGEDHVLLAEDDDLTRGLPWHERGYTLEPFISAASYVRLVEDVARRFTESLREAGADVGATIDPTQYHRYVRDDAMHLKALHGARVGYPLSDFPIELAEIVDRIGTMLQKRVVAHNVKHGIDRWHVRVIRPHSNDHNPLHRDVWLDRLRNAVNIYVPLAGSDEGSALPLAPGSHRWKESELVRTAQGGSVNGVSYTVPAVVGCDRPLLLERPNPRSNEVLLFSPYLVHGGAKNLNPDRTRMSLEMRFWRAD